MSRVRRKKYIIVQETYSECGTVVTKEFNVRDDKEALKIVDEVDKSQERRKKYGLALYRLVIPERR